MQLLRMGAQRTLLQCWPPPPEIEQDEKRKEQYPTEDFINDLASLKSCF